MARVCRVCREIFREACILSTGDVVCSCIDGSGIRPLGNINVNRIYDIFHDSQYAALREELLASDDSTYCSSLGVVDCPFKTFSPKDFEINKFASLLRNLHSAFKTFSPQDFELNKFVSLLRNPAFCIQNLFVRGFELKIDKIRLETTSFCNLRCKSCAVPQWMEDNNRRLSKLPVERIKEILTDTRDDLKQIWLYNYGEPFLDSRFLDILRMCREIVPQAFLYTHTNGTAIREGWIEQIVNEGLLDGISFSIDGASQDSYHNYRIGGSFEAAFGNLLKFVQLKRDLGLTRPDITWQYILFEWNDSDEELRKAQDLAAKHGITIQWIVTHTEGKSKKYLPGSYEYETLQGIKHYSGEIQVQRAKPSLPG